MSAVRSDLRELDLSAVEAAVGTRSYIRGRGYADGKRVLSVKWDRGGETLTGAVIGRGGLYQAEAFFLPGDDAEPVFEEGACTCPVGYNCKHVAALVIAAAERRDGSAWRGRRPAASAQASWEGTLRALVESRSTQAIGTPLAIELALRRDGVLGGPPRLLARLMRRGARGGWVNGSLAWGRLDTWRFQSEGYREDHLALAREFHAIHGASARLGLHGDPYGGDRTLDLSDCESAQLWSLLDDAGRLGMALVHARADLGEVARPGRGELLLDVTRADDGGCLVIPVIRVDGGEGVQLDPVIFIGANGHGVVCAEPVDTPGGRRGLEYGRLRLVRLARPAPPQLQRMVLGRARLRVPAGERDRFHDELCPGLRGVAPVVSSDGSFTPPEISAPALVLRATYGADHVVHVEWEWRYRVGGTPRRAPLAVDGDGPGFRDPDVEHAIVADAGFSGTGLEHLGLLDAAGHPAGVGAVAVSGFGTVRLSTETLPALMARPDLSVEIDGAPADYRDAGESLAIGVSTTEIAGERDWFGLGVTVTIDGRDVPLAHLLTALTRGESHMLLADGAYFSLLEPRLQTLRSLIEEARALQDSPSRTLRISRYQAGLWSELAALGVVAEQARAWQRRAGALLDLDTLADHEPPNGLSARLRPYQHDGFAWLATLSDLELGGILADDMGLGKTLQTLALICHRRATRPETGPFLIVAPTSVVSTWLAEAARFAPELRVGAVTDTLARSRRTIDEVLVVADVLVTTYTLLRLEADAYTGVPWAGVILDEAQHVKNHHARTYRCVRELQATFKVALTGTPVENNLMELWSLLSITAPGLFPDPKRFAEYYARPIARTGDAERLARLRCRIRPLVKRRTKELVAGDLPARQEQVLDVDLHPRHRKVYDTHLHRERQKVLGLLRDFDRNRFTILRSITLLRQLSLHAGLVDGRHDGVPCAKLDALADRLGDVAGGGHRALVFSQFTGFLARVRERLEHEGIGHSYLDGRTRRRDRVLERFKQGDDPVFLISLKAGGFGLNLTEADYCFLLDPWWNPAAEAQAIDRAHRIGQTRRVMAYRLIARDTIEEKVAELARRKADLFHSVMDDGGLFASTITAEDIRGLLE